MRIFALIILFVIVSYAQNSSIEKICRDLDLVPASKAVVQWERVFSSDRRMKKYKIDKLSENERKALKLFLVQHAADSNQPMVPGL